MKSNSYTKSKRPKLVWVIFIFYVLSAVLMLYSFYLVYNRSISGTEAQEQYFASQSVVEYGLTVLLLALNFAAALYLFFMRKKAPYLFSVNLLLSFLLTVWHTLTKGWLSAVGGSGLIGIIIGWGISIAVCAYSWRLLRRGVLT